MKKQLLEGQTPKRKFFGETSVFGFWRFPTNCDNFSGLGLQPLGSSWWPSIAQFAPVRPWDPIASMLLLMWPEILFIEPILSLYPKGTVWCLLHSSCGHWGRVALTCSPQIKHSAQSCPEGKKHHINQIEVFSILKSCGLSLSSVAAWSQAPFLLQLALAPTAFQPQLRSNGWGGRGGFLGAKAWGRLWYTRSGPFSQTDDPMAFRRHRRCPIMPGNCLQPPPSLAGYWMVGPSLE